MTVRVKFFNITVMVFVFFFFFGLFFFFLTCSVLVMGCHSRCMEEGVGAMGMGRWVRWK